MKIKLLLALAAVFAACAGWVCGDAGAGTIKSGILTSGDDSRGLITSVPRIMTYQGILTSTEGVIPDDIYDITFRIYTGPDDDDPIWSETYPCTTSNGYFTAVLAMEAPWDLPFDTDYYLSLQVEDDPEMSPRQRLTMSPYAARSDTCDYATDGGGWIHDGNFVRLENNSDLVGIGTATPEEKLEVAGNIRLSEEDITREIYVQKSDGEDEPGRNLEIYAGEYSDAGFAETKCGGDLILHGGKGYGLAGGNVYIYGGKGLLANPIGNVIIAHDGWVAGGNVGIATREPTEQLDVDGTARLRGISTAMLDLPNVVVDDNGVLWKEPGSSLRYKENIRKLDIDPDQVLRLQPVEFEWKASGHADIGLIAEEVDLIFPDLVRYNGDGNPDGVRYDKVVLYLLELVKAQQQKMNMLEKEIAGLRDASR